ncbi:hypothetical protein [Winogradskyella bathintestinalis]|uniref:Polysaccharide chain length determinant N-terminal domain-containing protein n=1 Tax=Winogradskyella bathintestinalis TaxID=3035208 RepID=A0ABT7ZRG5_9FLAO|nr:hypothetical protein [Winogradskyella bathintestinalis]MDN3491579.1 hypothetical protein [Winogradskyella bathintestinalis]
MSEKLPQQSQNEEVDLGQLFNAIGNLFQRFFNFIGKILKGLFSLIIFIIKPLVVYFKMVAVVLIIAAILGYTLEKVKEPVYYSNMVVKPYFDSKYQLFNNINYFNSLINSENITELSNIFEIDSTDAKELVSFDIEAGPETQNDLFIEYDKYVKSIDTSLVDELSYVDYVKNRDLISGSLFAIKAKSFKSDIFPKLHEGFRKTFENDFSKHQKRVRDTTAYIERLSLTTELSRLDSIQKTYLEVIKNESKNSKLSLGLNSVLPLQEEKTATKEYELFLKEREIRNTLNYLNQKIAKENTYFDVLSSFDKVGKKDKSFEKRYSISFPIIALILILCGFLIVKAFNYIKNYE